MQNIYKLQVSDQTVRDSFSDRDMNWKYPTRSREYPFRELLLVCNNTKRTTQLHFQSRRDSYMPRPTWHWPPVDFGMAGLSIWEQSLPGVPASDAVMMAPKHQIYQGPEPKHGKSEKLLSFWEYTLVEDFPLQCRKNKLKSQYIMEEHITELLQSQKEKNTIITTSIITLRQNRVPAGH